MKTILILIISLFLSFNSYAQLEDGVHYYNNQDIRVYLVITNNGETIEFVSVYNRKTDVNQSGKGSWHRINIQGVSEDYDGPSGYYEFQTYRCKFEFDVPLDGTGRITLSMSDCQNGEKASQYILTHSYIDEFLEPKTQTHNSNLGNAKEKNEAEEYFTVFLSKEGNELAEVFLEHQPKLSDCKFFFKESFYMEAYNGINQGFAEIGNEIETQNERFRGLHYCRASEFSTSDVIKGECRVCPGTIKHLADKVNPGIKCYSISFLETEDSEFGSRYALFTKINGRWVYFPIN